MHEEWDKYPLFGSRPNQPRQLGAPKKLAKECAATIL